ncbi:MAG: bifunctional metallophosphatase/5'-nucleotidase [Paludibacteraceae bacterium]|nr:bifunctional metallophosphatase/5'-nucleotidase [Paludibacteraceae bacterium]
MKRKYLLLFLVVGLITGCQAPDGDIYILYDNDVHCSVEGYEQMAALRADYLKQSIYVNVVSCGDFVQGNKVGSISKGKYPVAIMNAVPYDYVTLGNHEFDYGVTQLKKLTWWLRAKTLCCNFSSIKTGKFIYPSYDIRSYGTVNVGFVGVATPTTINNSLPINFQNDQGEVLYDFHKSEVVDLVQQAVNAAREEGADYVIVLSHLGDDTKGINSIQLIEQTEGIDVVLDGHSHHVLDYKVANLHGDSVLLASTGNNFRYAGCLKITQQHQFINQLIDLSSYRGVHKRLHSRIASILERVNKKTCQYIGFSQVTLTDSDNEGNRMVRKGETNLGDFTSDAMRFVSQSDIGISNGGGLRGSLIKGNITYGDLLQVLPFNNTLYKVEMTGQQFIDVLEAGVSEYPTEYGDFMHVSGVRYTFDSSIPSPVFMNEDGLCDSIGAPRRIVSVEVEKDGVWRPIEVDSVYTIGGSDYNLVFGGLSGMFLDAKQVEVEHIVDVDVLIKYIESMGDTIRAATYADSQQRIREINQ